MAGGGGGPLPPKRAGILAQAGEAALKALKSVQWTQGKNAGNRASARAREEEMATAPPTGQGTKGKGKGNPPSAKTGGGVSSQPPEEELNEAELKRLAQEDTGVQVSWRAVVCGAEVFSQNQELQ